MIVGAGTLRSGARIRDLAEHAGLGVYTAFRRQDAFPNGHGNYLGHLSLGTSERLLEPLRSADLILVLGSRLSEVTTQGYQVPLPEQRVVVCDVDVAGLGAHRRIDLAVLADAGVMVEELLAAVPPVKRDWELEHRTYVEASEPQPEHGGSGVHPDAVLAAMRRHLPQDVVLTNDAGNFSTFCHSRWRFAVRGTQLGPTSGAMGYAVPAAVGAALAQPHRVVVALAGDGGFLMTGQEIETAVRERAHLVAVVFQNGMHGTIAMHQARTTGRLAGVGISQVDVTGYARALGASGITVTDPADLDPAFEQALAATGPYVLTVRTDPDVLTPRNRLSSLLSTEARL